MNIFKVSVQLENVLHRIGRFKPNFNALLMLAGIADDLSCQKLDFGASSGAQINQ